MKIAKITLWDGRIFYSNEYDNATLGKLFDKAKAQLTDEQRKKFEADKAKAQVDLVEMTEDEYNAISTTNEAAELFKT